MTEAGNRVFTFLVGGSAGEGVKKAGMVASGLFAGMGRGVFQLDDYQSLIRGGHNFTVVSTAEQEVLSHYEKASLVVALDQKSYTMHRDHVAEGGFLVYNSDKVKDGKGIGIPMTAEAKKFPKPDLRIGVTGPAVLAAAVGLDYAGLEVLVRQGYPRDLDSNVAFAKAIYDLAAPHLAGRFPLKDGPGKKPIISGNEAIAMGAAAAGLDLYAAYPMTPASSILHFFAEYGKQLGIAVLHLENEIAVANLAVAATMTGARTMAGTSGGGFALMTEALSLAGIAEAPALFVLSQRPGPATGVPTYTSQGDLGFALNAGHGEFPRIVVCPGDFNEAFHLTAEAMELAWHFQTPAIVLTEKHLSESRGSAAIDVAAAAWPAPRMHGEGDYARYRDTEDGISPLLFPPSGAMIKWSSYEHDEAGITTEEGPAIARMTDKRKRKYHALLEHTHTLRTVNVYGEGDPVIITYGSTTMSVREALAHAGKAATVVQPRFLAPFPAWEFEQYRDRPVIVVETSSLGPFAGLIREKTGIEPAAVITRYDGRPFDPCELARSIKEAI